MKKPPQGSSPFSEMSINFTDSENNEYVYMDENKKINNMYQKINEFSYQF